MVDAFISEETDDQVVDLDEAAPAAESEGNGEGGATAPLEVVETVISEAGAQPERVATQGGVNRLLRKLGKAKAETRDVAGDLELTTQKLRMTEIALQQEREANSGPPDPSTFDDGISDPKYVEEQTAYIAQLAAKQVQKAMPVQSAPVDTGFDRAIEAHADRANKLGIEDYADVQDTAIDALGGETVNAIIKQSPKSEIILYYLGKNQGRAEGFRHLVDTDPVAAAVELGRMESRLTVERKSTTQPAPDPDDDLPGSSPSGSPARGPKGATFE